MIGHLLTRYRARRYRSRLVDAAIDDAAETFLEALLTLLKVGTIVDRDLRRSVADFTGNYRLATRDGAVDVGISFDKGWVDVREDPDGPFDATMLFRDADSILRLFSAANPDLLSLVLDQDAVVEGNLNYVYKLAYMSRHLQLKAMGQV